MRVHRENSGERGHFIVSSEHRFYLPKKNDSRKYNDGKINPYCGIMSYYTPPWTHQEEGYEYGEGIEDWNEGLSAIKQRKYA